MPSDDEVRIRYGTHAMISRKGPFTLVHLDRPDPALIASRTKSFDPDTYFEVECAFCAIARASGIVIFDDSLALGEEIWID